MSEKDKSVEEEMAKEENKDKETKSSDQSQTGGETTEESNECPQEKADVEIAEAVEEDKVMEDLDVKIDPAIIDKLTTGFLQKFLPTLEKSRASLDEVLSNQKILIETVEQENAKFQDCQAMEELTQTMLKAKKYYNKLITIKKDMSNLHDKSAKLKKRAVKLQQQRQKEELQKAQQREKEMENERRLAARVARPSES